MNKSRKDTDRERRCHSVVREKEKNKFRSSGTKLRHMLLNDDQFDQDLNQYAGYLRGARS